MEKTVLREIKGREVLSVYCFNSEGKPYDVDENHPMKGQKYNLYQFDGKVFIANQNDPFVKAQAKGEVYSIKLSINDEGQLSLAGWTSIAGEINMAKTEATLASFTAVDTSTVSEEELKELGQ